MARVRRVWSPASSPGSHCDPTGEGVGKVCEEVGYAGDERKVQRDRSTLALCGPRGWVSPGEVGAPALRASRSSATRLPTPFQQASAAAQFTLPVGSVPLGCARDAPVPKRGPQTRADPLPATAADGTPVVAGPRWWQDGAVRRAWRLGQSCRQAGGAQQRAPPRTLPGALALLAALALLLARPLSAAARSSRTQ